MNKKMEKHEAKLMFNETDDNMHRICIPLT